MAMIRSFRDLNAYQKTREETKRIFEMTRSFPAEEKFSLTDQIRRSSCAVKSMIAEAWGHRRYPAHFASKLTDAIGEANETQSWLDDSLDCRYITAARAHLDTAPGAPVSDPAGIEKRPQTRRIGDRRSAMPAESGAVSGCAPFGGKKWLATDFAFRIVSANL